MITLTMLCPICNNAAEDRGRFNDYIGPYSPYREIDELSLTNGFTDLAQHTCIHIMKCENCNHQFQMSVQESQF